MKKYTFIILLLANISLFGQITYVPDDNFEQTLIDLGYDTGPLNDYVLTANINGVTWLNVNYENISDLTGIEDFTALAELSCIGNQLISLDVSDNTALEYLDCHDNQLTSLDVSDNTVLTWLECYDNQLTSLVVSDNTVLEYLDCHDNQLTSLDVSTNTALEYLECSHNQLTSLDVSTNTALEYLSCTDNQLTSLDVSDNTVITRLYCYDNQLIGLDVSANTALTDLSCSQNQLTSLDVSDNTALTGLWCYGNQLTSLDIRNGTNSIILNFDARYNPHLTCIYVDDKSASYLSAWAKDATATYVENEAECSALSVNELKEDTDFIVYPNPVKETFSIQTNKKIETISVYNVSGMLVKTYNKQSSYCVSGLQSGLYYIHISCRDKTYIQKLIVE
jgi:hypothetical protein